MATASIAIKLKSDGDGTDRPFARLSRIERLVNLSVGTLAVLSTTMLSMGQRMEYWPILTGIAVAISLYFTDEKRWIYINSNFANIFAAIAALLSVGDTLHRLESESLLTAAAYLLVYLQIVLLFQIKTDRIRWQICMAGLLQVVVGAALNEGLMFGVLMQVYFIVGAVTLSLFYVLRETANYDSAQVLLSSPAPKSYSPNQSHHWPLAEAPAGFHIATKQDLSRFVLSWVLIVQVARLTFGALAFSFFLFFAIPRVGRDPIVSNLEQQTIVGFSQEVELGDLGAAIESDEEVMQIQFRDPDTESIVQVKGDLYLRGSVLVEYEGSKWYQARMTTGTRPVRLRLAPQSNVALVQEDITLEPLEEEVVFGVYPSFRMPGPLDEENVVNYDLSRQQMVRGEENMDKRTSFKMATTGIWRGRQLDVTPEFLRPHLSYLTQVRGDLTIVDAMAQQLANESGLEADDWVGLSRYLEQHFLGDPRYIYSLRSPPRDPALNPIEDFLQNNPVGHCEYYASALALMLRSLHIPSRLVVGFKDAEWNPLDGVYQVRQLHAHAWVEVYLPEEKLPELPLGFSLPEEYYVRGGWLRLDPTPGRVIAKGSTFVQHIRQWTDYARRLWANYVVGLTAERQYGIYKPLVSKTLAVLRALFDPQTWKDAYAGFRIQQLFSRRWVSWRGGLAAVAICFVLLGIYRVSSALVRKVLHRLYSKGTTNHDATLSRVEFYRRFEHILARHGISRGSSQTALEFAEQLKRIMLQRTCNETTAQAPYAIARVYYRVRFGQARLDKTESESVEQLLSDLDQAFNDPRGNDVLAS